MISGWAVLRRWCERMAVMAARVVGLVLAAATVVVQEARVAAAAEGGRQDRALLPMAYGGDRSRPIPEDGDALVGRSEAHLPVDCFA